MTLGLQERHWASRCKLLGLQSPFVTVSCVKVTGNAYLSKKSHHIIAIISNPIKRWHQGIGHDVLVLPKSMFRRKGWQCGHLMFSMCLQRQRSSWNNACNEWGHIIQHVGFNPLWRSKWPCSSMKNLSLARFCKDKQVRHPSFHKSHISWQVIHI